MSSRIVIAAMAGVALAACGGSAPPDEPSEREQQIVTHEDGWLVDYDNSRLIFTARQEGTSFTGEFRNWSAGIVLDPEDTSEATIEVRIDMTSAETGSSERDTALPGSDWFAADEFPQAVFVSQEVRKLGPESYEADGRLTIRDVSQDLTLPFTLQLAGNSGEASGSVTLMRDAFGVGRGEFATEEWIPFAVGVEFEIAASQPNQEPDHGAN